MPDDQPLDLALFDDTELKEHSAHALTLAPASQPAVATAAAPVPAGDPRLAPQPAPARLVDVANLSPEDRSAAEGSAARINFRDSSSLLGHGDGVLAQIAQASRALLTGVRLGDAGQVGQIAATVLDGVKILRISDLQAEGRGQATQGKGLVGRLLDMAAGVHSAFKGFIENRKKFLDLMDQEQARARKTQADLTVAVQLLDQQALAIRQSLQHLKIEIAAGQIALDRGHQEVEALRQHAVATGEAADAADLMEVRSALANFRGKIAQMRETLLGSAMLIPIIGQNKKAAETRIMQISNGLLVVIPRLMAVASQAAVQVDIARAAGEAEKLDDAARQITLLASQGAHDAATAAARSLAGDPRNIEVLAQVADETIKTMQEVIEIERQVAAADREREAKLASIRDRLIIGMQGAGKAAVQA